MFSTNVKKTCCNFTENDIFEKSKMADMLWSLHPKLDLLCANVWEINCLSRIMFFSERLETNYLWTRRPRRLNMFFDIMLKTRPENLSKTSSQSWKLNQRQGSSENGSWVTSVGSEILSRPEFDFELLSIKHDNPTTDQPQPRSQGLLGIFQIRGFSITEKLPFWIIPRTPRERDW